MTKIVAPWDDATVAALNRWQAAGSVHSFTCTGDRADAAHARSAALLGQSDGGVLVANPNGWHCPACGYTQDWAHGFMRDPPPDLGAILAGGGDV
jgi:hypothetical protein